MLWHRHDLAERVDDAMEANVRGIWAVKVSIVALTITAALQVAVVWLSGSTALFADTVHNFADALTAVPLWISFRLQQRGRSAGFTYGYGKTEDVAGVVVVGIIFFSACVAGVESFRKLVDPQPITHLPWLAAAALIGFVGNEGVALLRIRVGRGIGSAALVADGYHARVDGLTSLAVLIGAIGVAAGYPRVDPIVGLIITVTILKIVWDAAVPLFRRLLDGIEPEVIADLHHAPLHATGVVDVHEVRARWVGHRIDADLHITVDAHLSVAESHAIVDRVQKELHDRLPALGHATVHVCPD